MNELPLKGNVVLKLHPDDSVVVVIAEKGLDPGARVLIDLDGNEKVIEVREWIPRGHKLAIRTIEQGEFVIKFGHPIGKARRRVETGDPVHTHNLFYTKVSEATSPVHVPASSTVNQSNRNFDGYRRAVGHAGIRNYVLVVASVNCSASVVKAIARAFQGAESLELEKKGIHGVVPVTHSSGCAQAIGGEGYQVLNRTLAGWVVHPNVVGALIVGLGCEGTTFQSILEATHIHGKSDFFLEKIGIQDLGGTEASIAAGIEQVKKMVANLPVFEREPLPISELGLALNCGGSDGLSGLTANPVLGGLSDRLVKEGGMVALAEIPECHGAEELLFARAANERVCEQLRSTFEWWQNYAEKHQVSLDQNLAPGNIAGGITTILEKSLGAVSKAGTSPVQEVVPYAELIRERGFVLMNTPGFDPVSVTGLVAGGCHMVAFTTGRGSTFGCSIAPTIKISSNSDLFRRLSGDMDFDAGRAVLGQKISLLSDELFELFIAVASGKKTCSERLGMGWEEFVPWSLGETL